MFDTIKGIDELYDEFLKKVDALCRKNGTEITGDILVLHKEQNVTN
jgi:hypothetical protein